MTCFRSYTLRIISAVDLDYSAPLKVWFSQLTEFPFLSMTMMLRSTTFENVALVGPTIDKRSFVLWGLSAEPFHFKSKADWVPAVGNIGFQ